VTIYTSAAIALNSLLASTALRAAGSQEMGTAKAAAIQTGVGTTATTARMLLTLGRHALACALPRAAMENALRVVWEQENVFALPSGLAKAVTSAMQPISAPPAPSPPLVSTARPAAGLVAMGLASAVRVHSILGQIVRNLLLVTTALQAPEPKETGSAKASASPIGQGQTATAATVPISAAIVVNLLPVSTALQAAEFREMGTAKAFVTRTGSGQTVATVTVPISEAIAPLPSLVSTAQLVAGPEVTARAPVVTTHAIMAKLRNNHMPARSA
jgi:hypothetical protein